MRFSSYFLILLLKLVISDRDVTQPTISIVMKFAMTTIKIIKGNQQRQPINLITNKTNQQLQCKFQIQTRAANNGIRTNLYQCNSDDDSPVE